MSNSQVLLESQVCYPAIGSKPSALYCFPFYLTHLPLDKMAARLADDIFKFIFVNEKFCIYIKISLTFVPNGLINNNPALV